MAPFWKIFCEESLVNSQIEYLSTLNIYVDYITTEGQKQQTKGKRGKGEKTE
jgi:hypothetical protein